MIPRTFLVATDGSTSAMAAESMAAQLANALGEGEVELVHVIPLACLYSDVSLENVVQVKQVNYLACTEDQRRDAEKLIADAVARVRGMVNESRVRVFGKVLESPSPAEAIAEEAHAGGTCSLIVMGNRGLGGFERLTLGSVSSGVLHGAHCPVLVARAEE